MRILTAICILMILGCSKSTENLPAGLQYFPEIDHLEDGIAFKYYFHRGKKVAQIKTDIVYRKMKLIDNIITIENYNAEFQKVRYLEIEIEGNKWKTKVEKSYDYRNVYTSLFKEYTYTFKR